MDASSPKYTDFDTDGAYYQDIQQSLIHFFTIPQAVQLVRSSSESVVFISHLPLDAHLPSFFLARR